jgi:hypothetical protein
METTTMAKEPKKAKLASKEEKKKTKRKRTAESNSKSSDLHHVSESPSQISTTTIVDANKRPRKTTNDNDVENDGKVGSNGDQTSRNSMTATGSSKRQQKLRQRQALLDQVPKVDAETGMSYTKQQVRRMVKRVARGLHPVETAAERHARLASEAQLRKEEEAELAGLIVANSKSSMKSKSSKRRLDDQSENDSDDDDNRSEEEEDDDDDDDDDGKFEPSTTSLDHASPTRGRKEIALTNGSDDPATNDATTTAFAYEKKPQAAAVTLAEKPRPQKKPRNKPVPTDYVCSACSNKSPPIPHWIYDCPLKTTMPGTNQVSKKQRGRQAPADTKVFVSGLPFDATPSSVKALFASPDKHADDKASVVVQHCKLLKFADTGRCSGQAIVTLDSVSSAQRALALDGTVMETSGAAAPNKSERKQLRLRVTKVLNRLLTKAKKNHGSD